jgi:hypothetical protein
VAARAVGRRDGVAHGRRGREDRGSQGGAARVLVPGGRGWPGAGVSRVPPVGLSWLGSQRVAPHVGAGEGGRRGQAAGVMPGGRRREALSLAACRS